MFASQLSGLTRIVAGGLAVALAALGPACGGSGSSTPPPVSPTTPVVTLGGTYAGPSSDSTGSGRTTWVVSQASTTVSGTVTATTSLGTVAFSGTLSGNVSGTTLTYSITIPAGGISGFPTCSATITGTATGVTTSAISGTYSGTNSCTGTFDRGVLTLTKQ